MFCPSTNLNFSLKLLADFRLIYVFEQHFKYYYYSYNLFFLFGFLFCLLDGRVLHKILF